MNRKSDEPATMQIDLSVNLSDEASPMLREIIAALTGPEAADLSEGLEEILNNK